MRRELAACPAPSPVRRLSQRGRSFCRCMRFVKNAHRRAWVPHGRGSCPVPRGSLNPSSAIGCGHAPERKEDLVLDLIYVGLTIVVFAALWLLVKGVERFER
jgi:hypothetical protein